MGDVTSFGRMLKARRRALDLTQEELDNTWGVATSYDHLGYAALLREDHQQAREHFVRL